jgi:hypothetical protein
MSTSSDGETSIKNMADITKIKKKVLKKLKNGDKPNDILIEVYENTNLSRGNKLKIARYLVLKGADRSLMVNNDINYSGGNNFKKSKKSKKSKSKKLKKLKNLENLENLNLENVIYYKILFLNKKINKRC